MSFSTGTAPRFLALQRAFADYLRRPDSVAAPGNHEERRLRVYRNAVFHNVAALMQDNFPRIRAILEDADWHLLIRDYLCDHVATTSAFVHLPLEFLSYLEHERNSPPADPPFLTELAHFDWLETLVGADPVRIELNGVDRGGDLLADIPVVNPVLRIHNYRFPVHAITADYQPAQPPANPTVIAAFRDLENLYGFLDLNPAAARLLAAAQNNASENGAALIRKVGIELGLEVSDSLIDAGAGILERMRLREAILGTLKDQS